MSQAKQWELAVKILNGKKSSWAHFSELGRGRRYLVHITTVGKDKSDCRQMCQVLDDFLRGEDDILREEGKDPMLTAKDVFLFIKNGLLDFLVLVLSTFLARS